jgi:lipid II:glycine glycyltransferase (peptidoglycan interpeptide bridge formation enzyme)
VSARASPTVPSVVDATDRPAEEWDRLAAHSPRGHPFQSHAWGELKRTAGWTPRRFIVELDGEPVAVASLLRRRLSRLRIGRWAPVHLYAPSGPVVLGEDGSRAEAALTGLREIRQREGAAILTIDPRWERDGDLAATFRGSGFTPSAREIQWSRTAMIVPLLIEEQAQHALLRKSTSNLVNRARREAVATERVDVSDAAARERAFEELYGMVSETARRVGARAQGKTVQLDQWRALAGAGLASFWFAGIDGRRWIGNVLLHCGSVVVQDIWGESPGVDLSRVPANHLLQWEIIRWAAGAGFRGYDMGGVDSDNAPGLPRDASHPLWNLFLFKHGFGAQGVEYVRAHQDAANALVRIAWNAARRLR